VRCILSIYDTVPFDGPNSNKLPIDLVLQHSRS